MNTVKIIHVVGARPNFMKIAPVYNALNSYPYIKNILVHTGQHYNHELSDTFFEELGIPKPDLNLMVGSNSHAKQTAEIMSKFEDVLIKENPDFVLLVGDVNSTIACALTAAKMQIKIIHVEAGLRSFDRTIPEEINRLLTDQISDILFVYSKEEEKNLIREGIPKNKIFFVGNVMIDTLLKNLPKIKNAGILERLGLISKRYALVTLHRPNNVDSKPELERLLKTIELLQKTMLFVFPIHPRTEKMIKKSGLENMLKGMPNLKVINAQSYHNFGCLMLNARVIFTDSGGVQEESTVLGVPCITLRENTERNVTLKGTNRLIGTQPEKIIAAYNKIINSKTKVRHFIPKYWDGHASERIAKIVDRYAKSLNMDITQR